MNKIEIGSNDNDRQEGFLQVDLYGKTDLRADIRTLPFRHSLDNIFASHVLEHLPDADVVLALKSCRAALRPGGRLELYVPDLPWILRRFLKAKSHGERWALWNRFIYGSQENAGQYHRTGFSVKRLADCLIAAGFRQVKTRRTKRKDRGVWFGPAEARTSLMEVHAIAIA